MIESSKATLLISITVCVDGGNQENVFPASHGCRKDICSVYGRFSDFGIDIQYCMNTVSCSFSYIIHSFLCYQPFGSFMLRDTATLQFIGLVFPLLKTHTTVSL